MKLTKYIHSCIVIEEQGKRLIVDPGSFSPDFGGTDNVVGVVVTHIHPDHFSTENLTALLQANPGIKVFTTPEIVVQWKDTHAVAVHAGQKEQVGPFMLEFFGEKHAEIHSLKAVADNIAVMINDTLYYPGDSLTTPDQPVNVLAMPANAPWLKVSESIEFLKTINPSSFFRTHDDLLSKNGKMVYDTWFEMAAEAFGPKYRALNPGESIEI